MKSNEFSLGYFEFELSLGNQCEDFQVHIGPKIHSWVLCVACFESVSRMNSGSVKPMSMGWSEDNPWRELRQGVREARYDDGIQGKRTFKEEVSIEVKELLWDIAVRKTLTTRGCLSTRQLWVWKEKVQRRKNSRWGSGQRLLVVLMGMGLETQQEKDVGWRDSPYFLGSSPGPPVLSSHVLPAA